MWLCYHFAIQQPLFYCRAGWEDRAHGEAGGSRGRLVILGEGPTPSYTDTDTHAHTGKGASNGIMDTAEHRKNIPIASVWRWMGALWNLSPCQRVFPGAEITCEIWNWRRRMFSSMPTTYLESYWANVKLIESIIKPQFEEIFVKRFLQFSALTLLLNKHLGCDEKIMQFSGGLGAISLAATGLLSVLTIQKK